MADFTDKPGKVWLLDITFGDVERVRAHVSGVDGKPLDLLEIAEGGDFSPISGSVRKVIEVVFWLLYPALQDESRKTNQQDTFDWFASRLGGQQIVELIQAWEVALVNFIPNKLIKEAVGAVLEKQTALQEAVLEKAKSDCVKQLADGLDVLSGSSQANSGSDPATTASDSSTGCRKANGRKTGDKSRCKQSL